MSRYYEIQVRFLRHTKDACALIREAAPHDGPWTKAEAFAIARRIKAKRPEIEIAVCQMQRTDGR